MLGRYAGLSQREVAESQGITSDAAVSLWLFCAYPGVYALLLSPRHVLCQRLPAPCGVCMRPGVRRFPRIICPYGAGCVVSGKAEQKAHSNAMELTRQRRRWAHRQARRVHFLPEIGDLSHELKSSEQFIRPQRPYRELSTQFALSGVSFPQRCPIPVIAGRFRPL